MEKQRKVDVFSSNAAEIEAAVDSIVGQIQSSDIDQDTISRSEFLTDLTLTDTEGLSHHCELKCLFDSQPSTKLYKIFLYLTDTTIGKSIALRTYSLDNEYPPENRNGEQTVFCTADIEVYRYKESGIGSALLSASENIKASIARKVKTRFGIDHLRSVIRDDSNPPLWTSNSALALGYKFTGYTQEGYKAYEKDDDLSIPFSKEKINLAEHWANDSGNISRLKRYLSRHIQT